MTIKTKIVILSDTHGLHRQISVPNGDILIHCGDICGYSTSKEIHAFLNWFSQFSHPNKILVAGNHDRPFEDDPFYTVVSVKSLYNITYLQDTFTIVNGLKIYGSPRQRKFCNWAFNHTEEELREWYSKIPLDTDILVTHTPPHGILDVTDNGDKAGSSSLLDTVKLVMPKIHCFGHIHEAYGIYNKNGTDYINASICDSHYRPVNEPVVIEL
jgi:Icc-related predicted phosphoesterase